jgi:hypothetical protein
VLNASGYIVAQRKAAVASKVTGRLDALQHRRLFIQASKQQNFSLDNDAIIWHHSAMTRKHRKTLELIFAHPPSAKVKWRDIEALFRELGAEVTEREGSRVGVRLFGERRVFHRPHPSPDADKGAVASIRRWFEKNGVKP